MNPVNTGKNKTVPRKELLKTFSLSFNEDTGKTNLSEQLNIWHSEGITKKPRRGHDVYDQNPVHNQSISEDIQKAANNASRAIVVLSVPRNDQAGSASEFYAAMLLPSKYDSTSPEYKQVYTERFNNLIDASSNNIQQIRTFHPQQEQTPPLTPEIQTTQTKNSAACTDGQDANSTQLLFEEKVATTPSAGTQDATDSPQPAREEPSTELDISLKQEPQLPPEIQNTTQDSAPTAGEQGATDSLQPPREEPSTELNTPEIQTTQTKNSAASADAQDAKSTELLFEEKVAATPSAGTQDATDSPQPARGELSTESDISLKQEPQLPPEIQNTTQDSAPTAGEQGATDSLQPAREEPSTELNTPEIQTTQTKNSAASADAQDATNSPQSAQKEPSTELDASLKQKPQLPPKIQNTTKDSAPTAGEQGATDSPQPARAEPSTELHTPEIQTTQTKTSAASAHGQDATNSPQSAQKEPSTELDASLKQKPQLPPKIQNTTKDSAPTAGKQSATDSPQPARTKPSTELHTPEIQTTQTKNSTASADAEDANSTELLFEEKVAATPSAGTQKATDSPQPALEEPSTELNTSMKQEQPETRASKGNSTKQKKQSALEKFISRFTDNTQQKSSPAGDQATAPPSQPAQEEPSAESKPSGINTSENEVKSSKKKKTNRLKKSLSFKKSEKKQDTNTSSKKPDPSNPQQTVSEKSTPPTTEPPLETPRPPPDQSNTE